MSFPPGWQNPITAVPGQMQHGVDASLLLPSRPDLSNARLTVQRSLKQASQPRHTPILVTPQGVIWDGHHAVRVAAEDGDVVTVKVVADTVPPNGLTILQLPVR
jgi:hypothetical protein